MRRSESVNAPSRDREGAVTLEAIIGLPILLLVVMAIFEYGTIMVVHHAVMAAVTKGAREGAKVPTTLGAADRSRKYRPPRRGLYDRRGSLSLCANL